MSLPKIGSAGGIGKCFICRVSLLDLWLEGRGKEIPLSPTPEVKLGGRCMPISKGDEEVWRALAI
jgi:hypothetical protein